MSESSVKLWGQYRTAMVDTLSQGADWNSVQLVTAPLPATWNEKYWKKRTDGKKERKAVARWVLNTQGNVIPSWSANYKESGQTVTGSYELIFTNIDIPPADPANQQKANEAAEELGEALENLNMLEGNLFEEWDAFNTKQEGLPPNRQLSFRQWYTKFQAPKISAAQGRVDSAQQTYVSYLNTSTQGWQTFAQMQQRFNDPQFQVVGMTPPPNSSEVDQRTFDTAADLQKFIDDFKAGQRQSQEIIITSKTEVSHESTFNVGAKAGWTNGFVAVSGGGEYEEVNIDNTSDEFKMVSRLSSWQQFPIRPGGWYMGSQVAALENGPWQPGGIIGNGTKKPWGQGGIFPLMISSLVVVMQPEVEINLGHSAYNEVRKKWGATAGVRIGPFTFGGKAGGSSKDVTFNEDTFSISAKDTTGVPKIFAVLNNVLPIS
ncbi:MAG: hypothetical protein AAF481_13115 [Acidobacteriota bacterium]